MCSKATFPHESDPVLSLGNSRLEAIFNSINDAIIFTDTDRRIVSINSAVTALFGYSFEDLEGKTAEFLYADRAEYEKKTEKWTNNESFLLVMECIRKDGSAFFAESMGVSVNDPQGNTVGFISVHRDISERKLLEDNLLMLNRTLRMLESCNHAMIHAKEEQRLLEDVCEIIIKKGGYRLTWVGYAEDDSEKSVRTVARAGDMLEYLKDIRVTWADDLFGQGPTGTAIRTGKTVICRETRTDPKFAAWRERAAKFGIRSSIAIPLTINDAPLGALSIYSQRPDAFDREEADLLNKMAADLAYGIKMLRLEEERRKAEREILESREKLRFLALKQQRILEDERKRIARNIHDDLVQILTVFKYDLDWIRKRLGQDQAQITEKLIRTAGLVDKALDCVQRISSELRPTMLDDLGFAAGATWLAEEFQNRTGIVCNLEFELKQIHLDSDLTTELFRILQEALTNVARHAGATIVNASIRMHNGALLLELADNGRGITEEEISDPKSIGLIGIRERIHPWGGDFKIYGSSGKGTRITITIPLETQYNI